MAGINFEQYPTDKDLFRTRRVHFNALAGKYQQDAPTNYVYGKPTPEMKAWHDGISRALTPMQPATSRGFY